MKMSFLLRAYPGDFAVQTEMTIFVAVTLVAGAALAIASLFRRKPAVAHCLLVWALVWILIAPLATVAAAASGFSLISIPVESRDLGSTQRPTTKPSTPTAAADLSRAAVHVERSTINDVGGQPSPIATGPSVGTEAAARTVPDTTRPAVSSSSISTIESESRAPTANGRLRSSATVLLAIWFVGTILMFGSLERSFVRMRRIQRSLVSLDPETLLGGEPIRALVDDVKRRVGIDELPAIGFSGLVSTPCVLGIVRPAVGLPEDCLLQVSRAQFGDVLVHECAHVVRRDCLVVLLQRLATALFWLNPAVLLLNRCLTRVREEVCDNYVLAGTDAVNYSETLLHFAELARGARPIAASVGILHWRGRLERRIAGLVDERRSKQTRAGYKVAIVALATFGCLCFAACDVSFSSNQPSPTQEAPAGNDSKSKAVSTPPQDEAPQQTDSQPPSPVLRRNGDSGFGRNRGGWGMANQSRLLANQDNSGIEFVKDRRHTLSISEAQRIKLGIRKDGVDQIDIAERPKRMPPLVQQAKTYIPPNARVRLHAYPSPDGCKVQEIARISAPGPLKGEVTFREIQTGDHVKKGQLLAVLYSGDVANTMNDLVDAAAQLKLDEAILQRTGSPEPKLEPSVLRLTAERNVLADKNAMTRALRTLRGWDIPDTQIHQVLTEAAKVDAAGGSRELLQTKNWGRIELRSPIDGVVLERSINNGEAVLDRALSLFTVANLDTLLVMCSVEEQKLPALFAVGPDPKWTVRTKRGDSYTGIIAKIEPKDNWSLLEGPVDNSRGIFRGPGENVTVTVPLAPPPDVVEIPSQCVTQLGPTSQLVFVQKDPSKPEYTMQQIEVVDRLKQSVLVRSKPFAAGAEQTEEDAQFKLPPKEPLLPGARLIHSGLRQLAITLQYH
jgi:beta-lactamase regulating signal transducer with metallopeptidase domain/multidrug efflux pump subunit AcrA (membrane-fusion protein)